MGNWTLYYADDTDGSSWDLTHLRKHNVVNEIYDATDAIVTAAGTDWANPAYDATGNMTTAPQPNSPADTYTCSYDAWNRLVEVKDGSDVVVKYEYDGLNRRTKKFINTGADASYDEYRHYYYNAAWQVVETRLSDSENTAPDTLQPEYQYVWSLRYIDSPVLRSENTDTDDLCDDETLYYLTDANFNVTALVDTGGDAVERYNYDPYGRPFFRDSGWDTIASSAYDNDILYCRYRYGGETGLYQVRNRVYHAALGRWMQRDPIGYADGMNQYEYAKSGPPRYTDPMGTECTDWFYISGSERKDAQKRIRDYATARAADVGKGTITSCEAMAKIWEYATKFYKCKCNNDEESYVEDVMYILSGANEWVTGTDGTQVRGFSDDGFKKKFQDGSNQVQHFSAAVQAGFQYENSARIIHRVLRPDTPEDTALNDAGISLGTGLSGIGYGLDDVGSYIRKSICD